MSYQREFEHKLNIGLVGAGSHAYRNILPALHYLPVRVAAICDVNAQVAQNTAPEYGARPYSDAAAMYAAEQLDAVLLCVGPQLHPQLAQQAFAAGLHVWMEKPPAMRAAEIDTMLAARGDRVCTVGFKKAFMPATQKAIELFGADTAGSTPLQAILAEYPVAIPTGGAQILAERRSTDWLGNGCHPLSQMLAVAGPARSATTHRNAAGESVCIIQFAGGAMGTLHGARGAGLSQPAERISFFGAGCTLTIENSRRVTLQRGVPFEYGRSTTYLAPEETSGAIVWEPQNTLATLENMALFTQGMYGSLRLFCDQIIDGQTQHLGSLEFARQVMLVYEAALVSEGEAVEVG